MTRRLLLSYMTLTLCVLLALELPLGVAAARLERRNLLERVTSNAISFAKFVEDRLPDRGTDLEPETVEALDKLLESPVMETEEDRRTIVVYNGEVVADSGPSVLDPGAPTSRAAIQAARTNSRAASWRTSADGAPVLDLAVPLATADFTSGALQITVPAEIVDQRTRQYWMILAIGGVVVLVLVFIVSMRLSRSFTEPLNDLSNAARRLGQGDLSARSRETTGPDEVSVVIKAFNDTAAKLEQLIGAQRAFIADASHQLRTPLAALRLRLENLEAETPEGAREDLEGAIAEVRRLSTLVDGLLMLARAERELGSPQPIDVVTVVRDRAAAWEAFADERRVRLSTELPEVAPASLSPGHLEQVLDNLIANALEVSPPGGTVTLRVVPASDHVLLAVADEGPGMSPEERARAFDRFWRSSRAHAQRTGAGLGLAIVKQLLTTDGADIELAEAASGGLEARVRLRPARLGAPASAI